MATQTMNQNGTQAADIDWHNAPAGARWWSMGRDGKASWHIMAVCAESIEFISAITWPAPTFGYAADWRESLHERPACEMASNAHCLLRSAGCI